jgi:hypothetical protein
MQDNNNHSHSHLSTFLQKMALTHAVVSDVEGTFHLKEEKE